MSGSFPLQSLMFHRYSSNWVEGPGDNLNTLRTYMPNVEAMHSLAATLTHIHTLSNSRTILGYIAPKQKM